MPTGSYEGVVDEEIGFSCSMCGGGEDDIFCGRPWDGPPVTISYSGIVQHGRQVSRSARVIPSCTSPPIISRPYSELKRVRVVDRHPGGKTREGCPGKTEVQLGLSIVVFSRVTRPNRSLLPKDIHGWFYFTFFSRVLLSFATPFLPQNLPYHAGQVISRRCNKFRVCNCLWTQTLQAQGGFWSPAYHFVIFGDWISSNSIPAATEHWWVTSP